MPEPLLPPVTLMKLLLLAAVHVQLVPLAEMTMLLEPPAAVKLALVVSGETMHPVAACVTVKVCPATVIEPVWLTVLVLAATS